MADYPDALRREHRAKRRAALGHIAIAAAVMLALSYLVYIFDIPNPNIILMIGLTFFTTVYGYAAGAAASVVMVGYSMFFFSENHDWLSYTPVNLQKLSVIVLGAVVSTVLIGNLKHRQVNAARQLSEINRLLRADNQDLEEASLTDALTGARNRFGLRRDYGLFEGRDVHVMMLDVDDFKRTNDTFGHAVGDFMLKKAGRLLIEGFGADSCYRYGGDEFLVICRDMDEAVFVDRLDRLREGVNAIYLNDKHLAMRFSAGYVYGECALSDDLRLMIHQADGNLYDAKKLGRNRWVGTPFSRETARGMRREERKDEDWLGI